MPAASDTSRRIVEYGQVRDEVDLVVPVKTLDQAKSRLAAATGDPVTHAALALAFALDTITAARAAAGVRQVMAVTSDPAVAAELRALGVESVPEPEVTGLNAAVRHGTAVLRERDAGVAIGALQADLPALRPVELAAAIARAGGRRAFCPDRHGTGTTLLLGAPGDELAPRFGVGSAGAHTDSGAITLAGPWPSLRCDVDTAEDLRLAVRLGVGPRTAGVTVYFRRMSEQAPEQATVSAYHPDGSATVLRDDGLLVAVGAAAVRAGGWRALRPGQRLTLQRSADGHVSAVLRPVEVTTSSPSHRARPAR